MAHRNTGVLMFWSVSCAILSGTMWGRSPELGSVYPGAPWNAHVETWQLTIRIFRCGPPPQTPFLGLISSFLCLPKPGQPLGWVVWLCFYCVYNLLYALLPSCLSLWNSKIYPTRANEKFTLKIIVPDVSFKGLFWHPKLDFKYSFYTHIVGTIHILIWRLSFNSRRDSWYKIDKDNNKRIRGINFLIYQKYSPTIHTGIPWKTK